MPNGLLNILTMQDRTGGLFRAPRSTPEVQPQCKLCKGLLWRATRTRRNVWGDRGW